ncbi:Pentatricopeptide repeat-containing protein family [Quillaja saponaria]|uniref:Pentatricopeptide repeat-containing protein family n=1 Tax=Quillaja saponaria TaxID=32244 RepID=A0AAD7M1H5_QUISA|nr:Pentatricopeptide repeat-containing protein family [Quillaja saponaria]
MSLYRVLLRSLRRSSSNNHPSPPLTLSLIHHTQATNSYPNPIRPTYRFFAFSSAEEAAAERRRRKRRLRIEPPLNAIRTPLTSNADRDPNARRLPDSTSQLVGARLSLHNRVQSLIRAGDLDSASAVARHSVFSRIRPTVFTCNAIMGGMYRAKRYDDVTALHQFFFHQYNIIPNVVSYNYLIVTHCDEGRVDMGIQVYHDLLDNAPFGPSAVTYRHLTKGLVEAGRITEAVDLLREMLNKGQGADSLVYNNLIDGFLKLENLDKANEFFDELKERCVVYDGVINATYMEWFFSKGRDKEAMESYKSLLDRQFNMVPATCNVLLEVLLKHGKKKEAWALFDQMLDNHVTPNFHAVNSDTFNIMVNECFKLGDFSGALATFRKVGTKPKSRAFVMDVAGFNNIIARYCEHGMLSEAETMFQELCGKALSMDATTHKTLIDAYLKAVRIDDALGIFNRMVEVGLRVVASFGKRVFDELIKNGKVVDCAQILSKMGEKDHKRDLAIYDPKPDAILYEVVIKGLCNEGLLDKSRDLLDQIMRSGVGLTPALREFVVDAFGKVERGEEIERLLNMNRTGNFHRQSPSRPPYNPPPPTSPPQMSGFHNPSSGSTHQMAGQHSPPLPAQMRGTHQPAWGLSSQMAGSHQPASESSPQMDGQYYPASGLPPQMSGPNQSPSGLTPQMTGLHHSTTGNPPQMPGRQPHQTPSGDSGPSHQIAGHHYPNSGINPPPSGLASEITAQHRPPSRLPHQVPGQQPHPAPWGHPNQLAGQHYPPQGVPPPVAGSSLSSPGNLSQMAHQYSPTSVRSSQMAGPYQSPPGPPPQMEGSHHQPSELRQMEEQVVWYSKV